MFDAAEATSMRMTSHRCAEHLRPTVLNELHELLVQHNPWIGEFITAGNDAVPELTWRSDDVNTRSGIVAVVAATGTRSIIVHNRSHQLMRISDQHPLYFPLAYVLLWPTGGTGYSDCMTRIDPVSGTVLGKLHMLEWIRYLMMRRNDASLILSCGKLSLEFFCDVWSCIECRNLDYLSRGTIQSQFRASRYCTLMDQIRTDGSQSLHMTGTPVLLPASFPGSPRWYHALYHDALALPAAFHLPDLFVTVTFNPEWPEMARLMPMHSSIHDHPDVVARIFWLRFSRIMQDIVDNGVFGEVLSYCWRIEWQLRGLPHAHVLIILRQRILHAEDVDRFVSAEIPDPVQFPELHRLVAHLMIHGPCSGTNAPCIGDDGMCEKHFPKQLQPRTVMHPNAYPLYKRRGLHTAQVRGQPVTDEWVVPHNLYLLSRHRSHICVEVASHLILYKYVYKYCFKPPDHGTINFNEIAAFISGRILSSAEAVWRILQLPLHKEFPTVQRLSVHLPGHHLVVIDSAASADAAGTAADASTSTLLQWFALNARDPAARALLYKDVPKFYKWNKKLKEWQLRKYKGCKKVARMHGVSSHNIELFMLRRLLLAVPGATCWADLRTVEGQVYPSFEAAARARGMLNDDFELIAAFQEIVQATVSDSSIRRQFCILLAFGRPVQPREFFMRFQLSLFPPGCDIGQVWGELVNLAIEFRISWESMGIHPPVMDVGSLPLLEIFDPVRSAMDADSLWAQLNDEQRQAADAFLAALNEPRGDATKVFMLQASGGCGKSFVANYIAARVRSHGAAAICVAASAQAAAVLRGGRTAHGQLRIPIECDSGSFLDLKVDEKREIANAAALLWDEASMVADTIADCVNKTFQDIMQCKLPFGGMPVLFIGDWRQLLPVVPRLSGDHHTLQRCSWWQQVRVLKLLHNWRCQHPRWMQLLDDVGMGRINNIEIDAAAVRHSVEDIVAHVWADATSGTTTPKAILTLTLDDAAVVNHKIISALPGDVMVANCYDTYLDCKEPDLYPEEFVQSLQISGVPPGQLELKVGARYIIMRNMDQRNGVVNGAQLMCTALSSRMITGVYILPKHHASPNTPQNTYFAPSVVAATAAAQMLLPLLTLSATLILLLLSNPVIPSTRNHSVRCACWKANHDTTNHFRHCTISVALAFYNYAAPISGHSGLLLHRSPLARNISGPLGHLFQRGCILSWFVVYGAISSEGRLELYLSVCSTWWFTSFAQLCEASCAAMLARVKRSAFIQAFHSILFMNSFAFCEKMDRIITPHITVDRCRIQCAVITLFKC
jgi:hypothetical protein